MITGVPGRGDLPGIVASCSEGCVRAYTPFWMGAIECAENSGLAAHLLGFIHAEPRLGFGLFDS